MGVLSVETGVSVPAADGVALIADVIRPSGPGRWPAIVVRTPYGRTTTASRGLQVNALALAESGYGVVIEDVRGRGGSPGRFEPFVNEGSDGAAAIEWAALQPWCDGRVGTAGISYLAYAQLAAAALAPEPLQAWVPGLGPCDVRTSWVRHGALENDGFNRAWIEALDEPVALPADWDERVPTAAGLEAVTAAALVVAGHYDVFHHGSHELFGALPGNAHRLLAGPWGHTGLPLARRAGERDFGPAAVVDLHDEQLAWFDLHLRDVGAPPPVARVFVSGRDRWEDFATWPPRATVRTWHPSPGALLAEDDPGESVIEVTVAFGEATPALGGRAYPWEPALRAGCFDQSSRRSRADVAAWVSQPLAEEVVSAGSARCVVDAVGPGYVFVTLGDVDDEGRVWNVADGAGVVSGDRATTVELGCIAHAFQPGHAIGLDVSFGAFPRFAAPTPGPRRVTLGAATRLELPCTT